MDRSYDETTQPPYTYDEETGRLATLGQDIMARHWGTVDRVQRGLPRYRHDARPYPGANCTDLSHSQWVARYGENVYDEETRPTHPESRRSLYAAESASHRQMVAEAVMADQYGAVEER